MNQVTFGKLIANGFKRFVINKQVFYFKSANDPVYEPVGRVCKLVTDLDLVEMVEEYVKPVKR